MAEFGELEGRVGGIGTRRERSDGELLRAVRAGDERAAEQLVARHWDGAYGIAFAILGDCHLAEDVTQEAMVAILASVGRFDTRRPLAPWLHRIVSNRALDSARARARRAELARRVAPPVSESGSDPGLVEALRKLPAEQRAVVVLRHVAGYGTNEIARMLGIRRGTAGSRLRRGLDQLRVRLEEGDG